MVVIASIVLWYQYFLPPSVGQILLVKFHMSFRYFILTIIVGNLLGAAAAIIGQVTDRIGRCWVVIVGLGIVALLQLFAVPNCSTKVEYLIAIGAVGFFEGIILVATPALVRDFTPQLGSRLCHGFLDARTRGRAAGGHRVRRPHAERHIRRLAA